MSSLIVPADGPIITEDELTSLPLVKVVPDGQYTGPKLNTVVRMMRGLLEQKVPLQEFEVGVYCALQCLIINYNSLILVTICFFLKESSESPAPGRLFNRSDQGEQEEESIQEYRSL